VSANEDVRDDLVEHDIDLQRLSLTAKHDIQGAVRKSTREKRLMEFQADAREVINAATKDVHDLLRKNLRGIAKLESTAVVDSIMEGLGEEV
jgi:predicted PilT family ATPase